MNMVHQGISKNTFEDVKTLWYCHVSIMIDFGNYFANIAPLNDIWLFSLYFFYKHSVVTVTVLLKWDETLGQMK